MISGWPPGPLSPSVGSMVEPVAPVGATHRQLIERVLDETSDWRTFAPKTSLQRAVIQSLREGRAFRTMGGVRLRKKKECKT